MTSQKPTSQQLAQLFVNGWKYIRQNVTSISQMDNARIDLLIELAQNPFIGLVQLESLVLLSSLMPISNFGYKPIQPVHQSPETMTCFQFGAGRMGWYFLKGSNQDQGFTYMIFRLEIAPPAVVASSGIAPQDAVIYTISAGCGNKQKWYYLPRIVMVGDYKCNPDSKTLVSFTGTTDLIGSPFQSTSFNISSSFEMNILASWIDGVLPTGTPVGIKATMKPHQNTTGVYNGPDGCLPCSSGAGSIYWSFTNMNIFNMQVGDKIMMSTKMSPGSYVGQNGWFDHQWINSLASPVLPYATTTRWLWIPIQLENTNVQYMMSVILSPDTKLPLHTGQTFKSTFLNKYVSENSVTRGIYNLEPADITILQTTIGPQGQIFPTKYAISFVDNGTRQQYVLTNTFSKPTIVTLPNGVQNWEAPGTLWDYWENKIVGSGFLEANQLLSTKEIITITQEPLQLSAPQLTLFLPSDTGTGTTTSTGTVISPCTSCSRSSKSQSLNTTNNVWISVLLFLLALALIILAIWLFTRDDSKSKKSNKQNSYYNISNEYGELFGPY